MKKIILIISTILFSISSFSQDVKKANPVNVTQKIQKEKKKTEPNTTQQIQKEEKTVDATIDFESKVVDYGVIEFQSNGKRKFIFTNNGRFWWPSIMELNH